MRRLTIAYAVALGVGVFLLCPAVLSSERGSDSKQTRRDPFTGRTSSRQAIKLFEERVGRNPLDAVSYTILGQLYERYSRENDDPGALEKAEAALRRALELLPSYSPASTHLASVLYARHRFAEALELAQRSREQDPRNDQALAILADSQVELGRYTEAEKSHAELFRKNSSAPVLARLSNLRFLQGDTEKALQLMHRALEAKQATDEPTKGISWYEARLADLYRGAGRLEEAARWYLSAREEMKGPELAHVEMHLAGVRAAEGRHEEAQSLYEHAASVSPQPSILGALGDFHARMGRADLAGRQYQTVDLLARRSAVYRETYRRELSLFYSDHDRNLPEALELAREEWSQRKDVHTADALGWALYKNGHLSEAAASAAEAIRLGTRDASLYYHAGIIAHARGERSKAHELLQTAVEIDPNFPPLRDRRTVEILTGDYRAVSGARYGIAVASLIFAAILCIGIRRRFSRRC